MFFLMISTISFSFLLDHRVNAQINFESPCPHLFLYEGMCDEPDRWYGIVILLSDRDLYGIRLRLIFDEGSIQIGNWFGNVETVDYKEYLIINPTFNLKANVPKIVRFYVQFNELQPVPKLLSFHVNEKIVCPEKVFDANADSRRVRSKRNIGKHLNPTTTPKTNGHHHYQNQTCQGKTAPLTEREE